MRNNNSINRNIEFEFKSQEAMDLKSGFQKCLFQKGECRLVLSRHVQTREGDLINRDPHKTENLNGQNLSNYSKSSRFQANYFLSKSFLND